LGNGTRGLQWELGKGSGGGGTGRGGGGGVTWLGSQVYFKVLSFLSCRWEREWETRTLLPGQQGS